MMRTIGDAGLVAAGFGVIVFWVLFGVSVKWWTDWLGRIIFAFFSSIGIIMALVIVRITGIPLPYIQLWRAVLFSSMALTIWGGVVAFVWAQFVQRRVRSGRSTPTNEGTTPR